MISIRPAHYQDIPGIMAILHSHLMANKKNPDHEQLEQNGFLIHGYPETELMNAIAHPESHILLVAIENNEVVGYILTYDLQSHPSHASPEEKIVLEAQKILTTEKVLYHRHIARKSGKKGIGTQLLKSLCTEAQKRHYQYIFCRIVEAPHKNKISIATHQKLGFTSVGSIPEEGRTLGIYLKKL